VAEEAVVAVEVAVVVTTLYLQRVTQPLTVKNSLTNKHS
jgi:hypothetical protein